MMMIIIITVIFIWCIHDSWYIFKYLDKCSLTHLSRAYKKYIANVKYISIKLFTCYICIKTE